MHSEIFFFSKKKKLLLNFASFLCFIYLLPGFNIERSGNALLMFEEGAIEHILRPKYDLKPSKAFSGKI